jgi:hypothetical protein
MKIELDIPDSTMKAVEAVAHSMSQTPSQIISRVLYDRFINLPTYYPAHVDYSDLKE